MIWLWILIALYVMLLVAVWGFYLIAKIHTYKFKEYSTHIVPVTRLVGAILFVLTIIGGVMIVRDFNSVPTAKKTVQETSIEAVY